MRLAPQLAACLIFVPALCAAEPITIAPRNPASPPRQPQAAVSPDGVVYVAYGAGETIHCCVSSDGGKTFGDPVRVGHVKRLALGKRRGPRVAADAAHAVITAISHETGDLLCWRSTDRGRTWSAAGKVNDVPKAAVEGLHALAIGPRGDLFCTWLDLRNKQMEIAGSRSADGGATWQTNRLIYHSPDGTVCECCHPSAAFNTAGRLLVMWRNSLDGNRDMYLCTSDDQGESFSKAVKLGTGNWPLNACPMDGGALAPHADGSATTIWRRDRKIIRFSAGQEDLLDDAGEQPWAAATARGPCLAWVKRRGGDLMHLRPSQNRPTKLALHASDPVVAAPLTGHGPLIVAWESGLGKEMAILAEVISDNDDQ